MSRHDRLAQRLRGAGRITVDSVPVHFSLRDGISIKAALVPTSTTQLNKSVEKEGPMSATRLSKSTKKEAITNKLNRSAKKGKYMDFQTPKFVSKTVKKVCASPKIVPTPLKAVSEPEPQVLLFAGSIETSTPELGCRTEEKDLAPSLFAEAVVDTSKDQALQTPSHLPSTLRAERDLDQQKEVVQGSLVSHSSARKRKRDSTDDMVPVQVSPIKKVKRKLRGLLRELGPGASRFIIGAPNFATPAKSRVMPEQTPLNESQPERISRRVLGSQSASNKISLRSLDRQSPKPLQKLMAKDTARQSKSCMVCQGRKAWKRWHSFEGGWKCNDCYKKVPSAERKSASQRPKSRSAYSLSDDELVLALVLCKKGVSFGRIATKLGKWKSGQSVKVYLAKQDIKSRATALASRVDSDLASTEAIVPHGSRKASDGEKPSATCQSLAALDSGEPDEDDLDVL